MLVDALLKAGELLIDKVFPDKTAAGKAKLELLKLQNSGELAILTHESDVIKEQSANIREEIKSDSWLARNWRPILMLTFAGLVVARMFGYTAPNVTTQEYLELWSIIKLGIGGYIIGRSAEKVASKLDIKDMFKKGS